MRSMLALAALALASAASAQTTWYVDVNGTPPGSGTVSDPYTSINYAVSQASTVSGDLVMVASGTYHEQVFIQAKGVHVKAASGPSTTIINAGQGGSAVAILGTGGLKATLEGFTLTNGSGTGISTPQGGGVYAAASLVRIIDCVIEENNANFGGGLFFRNCVVEVEQTVIRKNATFPLGSSIPDGGGIYVGGGTVSLIGTLVENNKAGTVNNPGFGGGAYAASAVLNAKQTVIRGNNADRGGGGLYVNNGTVEACLIEKNWGQYGGGVQGGEGLFIHDSTIQDNLAISASGAGHYGGGVYGPATLVGCTLVGNQAFGTGGGAHSATLIDCFIASNWAALNHDSTGTPLAGGAYGCTLINCVVTMNTSISDGSVFLYQAGGAVLSTLVHCKVSRNTALGFTATGGGISQCDASFTAVYDNFSAGYGGGVVGGTSNNCTVFGNRAAFGAGGILLTGQAGVAVTNSIVWNNGQEIRHVSGSASTVTYSDVKGGFPGIGNINLDPQFWNEATRDFHLLPTSPCIDAGDPMSPADPDGSVADMGAFPYDPSYTGG